MPNINPFRVITPHVIHIGKRVQRQHKLACSYYITVDSNLSNVFLNEIIILVSFNRVYLSKMAPQVSLTLHIPPLGKGEVHYIRALK